MTPETASEVVKGLSEPQREAVLAMRWSETEEPISYDAHANGEYCCERHATMVGLAVRDLLLQEKG